MCKPVTRTHIDVYIRMHECSVSTLPSGRPYLHPRPRASECPARVRTRARIGGAAANNGPRPIEARPSASAIVRAAGPGAAHTSDNEVTRAVFHAPMFALNADAR
jgi:hypothetical protein